MSFQNVLEGGGGGVEQWFLTIAPRTPSAHQVIPEKKFKLKIWIVVPNKGAFV